MRQMVAILDIAGGSVAQSGLLCAGCDALTVHLAVTTIGTSIAVGYTPWCILGVMTIMGPWLLAHWEEYHSGIMLYGNGYWGVTEANYLMILLHFFTAAVGPGVLPGIMSITWVGLRLPDVAALLTCPLTSHAPRVSHSTGIQLTLVYTATIISGKLLQTTPHAASGKQVFDVMCCCRVLG